MASTCISGMICCDLVLGPGFFLYIMLCRVRSFFFSYYIGLLLLLLLLTLLLIYGCIRIVIRVVTCSKRIVDTYIKRYLI